jgi:hypothetical protein
VIGRECVHGVAGVNPADALKMVGVAVISPALFWPRGRRIRTDGGRSHQIASRGRGNSGQDRGFDLSAAAPNTKQGPAATVFEGSN